MHESLSSGVWKMRQNMSRPTEPKLSREAWRMFTVVAASLAKETTEQTYIADIHMTRRARLLHKELPSVLTELQRAGLVLTKQGRHGCTFWLPEMLAQYAQASTVEADHGG